MSEIDNLYAEVERLGRELAATKAVLDMVAKHAAARELADDSTAAVCEHRGPRIGEDVAYCALPAGHPGSHLAHRDWGRNRPSWPKDPAPTP